MASLSPCLSTIGDAYEKPIFFKGDAASYEGGGIFERRMESSEMPPHWVAYTSPRNVRYYYHTETKEMRLSKPKLPDEDAGTKAQENGNPPSDPSHPEAADKDESNGVVDTSAERQDPPANPEDTSVDFDVPHLDPDLEDRLPSSDSPISKTAADEEMSNASNASVEQQIPTNSSQSAAGDTKAARADLEEIPVNAQEQSHKMHTQTPTISVTVSPRNMQIDLGSSTGDISTLADLPETRPLTPTNGIAAEARAAIARSSEEAPRLLGLSGENPAMPSISGATVVGEDDDNGSLDSATSRDEYSPAYRLRMCKAADGVPDVREDLVFGADLEDFDAAVVRPGTITLCFVASNTQENSIYASQETIECILKKYGLQTVLGRLGARPQMGTHQVILPIDNDDFVFTCRAAPAVNASTFLCYRYRHSDRSIFGLVLDRRERSGAFIDILKTLDTNLGFPLLPALSLALFGLRANIRTLRELEGSYYLQKNLDQITYLIGSGSSRPAHFGDLLGVLHSTFNGLYSVVGSLNVSMSAILALTKLFRDKDSDKQFSYFVDAIDSETRGHIEAAARTQARIGQRHNIFTAAMQTTMALQAHDANTKQALTLTSTREATAASTETLKTMVSLQQQSQEANAKQALVLISTREATFASTETLKTMQELLAGTQELNRKAEEVARKAADYGILVLCITSATFVAGCVSTCAEIFQMPKSERKFISIPIVLSIIISIGFGYVSVRYINLRAERAKKVSETPSAQQKVEDASD